MSSLGSGGGELCLAWLIIALLIRGCIIYFYYSYAFMHTVVLELFASHSLLIRG